MIATTNVPQFFGYCRVSTTDQIEGYSLKVQEDQLKAWYEYFAKPKGMAFGGVFKEPGVSAFKMPFLRRPIGNALWSLLKPGDCLAMTKLDRGFRDVVDCLTTYQLCVDRTIKLVMLDVPMSGSNTATDELILTVLAAVSRFESRRKSERVREARALAESQGKACGGPRPWGELWKGRPGCKYLVPCEPELGIIGEVVRLREQRVPWEALSERIQRLIARNESKKYSLDKPITLLGRQWSPTCCRMAYEAYLANPELRERVQKCDGVYGRA